MTLHVPALSSEVEPNDFELELYQNAAIFESFTRQHFGAHVLRCIVLALQSSICIGRDSAIARQRVHEPHKYVRVVDAHEIGDSSHSIDISQIHAILSCILSVYYIVSIPILMFTANTRLQRPFESMDGV